MHRLVLGAVAGACVAAVVLPRLRRRAMQRKKTKVLVTGFLDWQSLGTPPNIWRCRDNPASRLLLGPACDVPPVRHEGALVAALRRALPDADVCTQVLPTIWKAACGLDRQNFDVVVHLGLGVYDSYRKILVEDGAKNARRGKDALGHEHDPKIEGDFADVLSVARLSSVVQGLHGTSHGGFCVEAISARDENAYICNETHWTALRAVQDSDSQGGRLAGAFFVHIPHAERPNSPGVPDAATLRAQQDLGEPLDFAPLAQAVASVIAALVDGVTGT